MRRLANLSLALLAAAGISLAGATANAVPFYDNIGGAFPVVGIAFAGFNNQLIADDFVVPVGVSTLGGVSWTGNYIAGAAPAVGSDVFTVRIFTDNGGLPSTTPLASETQTVTRTASGNGFAPFAYSLDLSTPVGITAGDTLWISLFNEATALTATEWTWGISSPISNPGNMRFSNDITQPGGLAGWFIPVSSFDPPTLDFSLSSAVAVPSPATFPLFGAGLLAVWLIGRRRQHEGVA